MQMPKRRFGKTGLQVTSLGLGAAPAAYLKTDPDRAVRVFFALLDAGANVIDTAASYPGSEAFIGQHIGRRRGEFVLISKCPGQDSRAGGRWSAQTITESIDRSLRDLRTDLIDVMLLHSCDLATLQHGEAVGALDSARAAGKIRFAGYSGDNEAAAYAASLPQLYVIETSISIADQWNIDIVLPPARKADFGVIAKRPIANAAWRQPDQQPGFYRGYAQIYHDRLNAMRLDPRALGSRGEPDWPEIALRFTLSQEGVHTAIVGTTNPDNAAANVQYAQAGPLPRQTIEQIRQAFVAADPSGQWLGQT